MTRIADDFAAIKRRMREMDGTAPRPMPMKPGGVLENFHRVGGGIDLSCKDKETWVDVFTPQRGPTVHLSGQSPTDLGVWVRLFESGPLLFIVTTYKPSAP